MAMTRVLYPSAQPVYEAARRWRDAALLEDRSLFSGGAGSTLADGQVLVRDFVNSPDPGTQDFLTKLRGQLGSSPSTAIQLAAELLYVHLLIARSDTVSGARKREIVQTVLGFAPDSAALPADLAAALDAGLVRPGQAFNSRRWRQYGYLIEVFVTIKALGPQERHAALTDPDRFVAVLDQLNDQGAAIQRHALEHLLFPDVYPAIVSQDHRAQVLKQWPELAGPEEASESLRIARLVGQLEPNVHWGADAAVNLYRSPYLWQWSTPDPAWRAFEAWGARLGEHLDLDEEERTYKLEIATRFREARDALESGSPEWVAALKRAFDTRQNNLVAWQVSDPFLRWVTDHPEVAAQAVRELWAQPGPAGIDRFLAHVPDEAAHAHGARLSLASVLLAASDISAYPPWRASVTDTAYRLTGFAKAQPPATSGERYDIFLEFLDQVRDSALRMGLTLRDPLDAQGLTWALVNYAPDGGWTAAEKDALAAWRSGKGVLPPAVASTTPSPAYQPADGSASSTLELADLAAELYLEEEFLDETVQLLRDKGQVIFYGPPGTGKTYVARRLADWIAGDPSRVRLVQFHPSYAYEDFVEGLRPRADQVGFHRVDGPLLEMARLAAADRSHDYVLVVDEVNRGNVARVFGELYFLLEYRDQPARLLYSQQEFRLPANLFLIGTMNSADRSIALLDTALRRRFYFRSFSADQLPISQVLPRYLQDKHPDLAWVADVVHRANTLLADPAAAIGPSHFIRDDLDETWVKRAWDNSVMPTLEDHFYGQRDRLAEFDLDRLHDEVTGHDADADVS